VSVKSKSSKLIKAPKGKSVEDLKQEYLTVNHPATKKMLFILIRLRDPNFKG